MACKQEGQKWKRVLSSGFFSQKEGDGPYGTKQETGCHAGNLLGETDQKAAGGDDETVTGSQGGVAGKGNQKQESPAAEQIYKLRRRVQAGQQIEGQRGSSGQDGVKRADRTVLQVASGAQQEIDQGCEIGNQQVLGHAAVLLFAQSRHSRRSWTSSAWTVRMLLFSPGQEELVCQASP